MTKKRQLADAQEISRRIDAARAAAGLSQRGLAEKAGISQPTLSRIISGDRAAKMSEIVALAWATGHTVAQLTGSGTVAERIQFAARAASGPAMEKMRPTLQHYLELDEYLDDYAIPAGMLRQEGALSAEAEGEAAAARFRKVRGLGVGPVGDLVAVIEAATGHDVAVLDALPDEHGLAARDPERGVAFIGVARTRSPMRQRSTLAHELGHVLFGDWGTPGAGERTHEEVRADSFARHLLVPAEGLRGFLDPAVLADEAALSAVVQQFEVSPAMAAIALHQAGYIDAATRQDWMRLTTRQLAARFGWTDRYQALQSGSDQRRAPQRLLARAVRGYAEGVLSAQAIATLRAVSLAAAEGDLREGGVTAPVRSDPWSELTELPEAEVDMAALDRDLA